jgi:hypothetical protein
MWNLVRRAINRWLAALFMLIVGWWAKRYAGPVLVATVLFILAAIADHYLGDWASFLGVGFAVIVPFLFAAASLAVFVWSIRAHALEPVKPPSRLEWPEEEM